MAEVLSLGPLEKNNPLLEAMNCFITPHIAWATRADRERLLKIAVDNAVSFLAGRPKNVVNGGIPQTRKNAFENPK
jgi:glycerate dehydrogenase